MTVCGRGGRPGGPLGQRVMRVMGVYEGIVIRGTDIRGIRATADLFAETPRLLNATLSQGDADVAARYVLRRGEFATAVRDLHSYIRKLWGVPYVASFLGGRAALYAIVQVLGLRAGDQVLVPAFTCQAVANAMSFNGVELVFVDIDHQSFGMSVDAARKAVTKRTKAVLLQHTFGLVGRDVDALLEMAAELQLYVIEDCAHATGGEYRGAMLGTLGDIAFFSSERSKVVNTIHGGWVITRDERLGGRLADLHGRTPDPPSDWILDLLKTLCHEWSNYHRAEGKHIGSELRQVLEMPYSAVPQMSRKELGGLFVDQYGLRMPGILAHLLGRQLERLPRILTRRRSGAAFWERWASDNGVEHCRQVEGSSPSWLRFPIFVDPALKRHPEKISAILGCDVGVWFTTPIHPQPLLVPDCPVGMSACATCVNLPTWLPAPAAEVGNVGS